MVCFVVVVLAVGVWTQSALSSIGRKVVARRVTATSYRHQQAVLNSQLTTKNDSLRYGGESLKRRKAISVVGKATFLFPFTNP